MKLLRNITSVMVILFLVVSTAMAQQVPDKAKDAFKKKFPNARQVNWGMEGSDEYEAEFTLNGTKMSANFDRQGNWKETETAIAQNDLPDAVQQTLSGHYKKASVKQAYKVENPDRTVYEVEVSTGEEHGEMNEENEEQKNEKGENEQGEYGGKGHARELVFTKDGKLVKK